MQYEATFNAIDNILRNEAGCSNELDYIEQTSWLLFLKYLDDLESDREDEAELDGTTYKRIITGFNRWSQWAAPKDKDGNIDVVNAMTGDDLVDFVNQKLFPTLAKFKDTAVEVGSLEYKIGEIFTELRNKMASGEEGFDYVILPEPMVTIAKANAAEGVTLTTALDLTAEWDEHFTEGSLVQGCVVARKEFIEAHPEVITTFLKEYKQSIEFVVNNPAEASVMIKDAGIFAQAPVAERAIPKCNIAYIDGNAMKTAMEAFLAAMPLASIGGKLPDAGFYYGAS